MQDAARGRSLVESLHAPEHIYVLRAAEGLRGTLNEWVRDRRYENVFVPSDPTASKGRSEEVLLRAAARAAENLLAQPSGWDYLLDLPDTAEVAAPVGALARWLGLLNGTSVVGGSRPLALARHHVAEAAAALRSGSPAHGQELFGKARERAAGGDAEAWAGFWGAAARGSCAWQAGGGLAGLLEAGGRAPAGAAGKVAPAKGSPLWGLTSPAEAQDAGHEFRELGKTWLGQHGDLARWVAHALFALRSAGEQRVQRVTAVTRRFRGQAIIVVVVVVVVVVIMIIIIVILLIILILIIIVIILLLIQIIVIGSRLAGPPESSASPRRPRPRGPWARPTSWACGSSSPRRAASVRQYAINSYCIQ